MHRDSQDDEVRVLDDFLGRCRASPRGQHLHDQRDAVGAS
jgi:hypothetical protein